MHICITLCPGPVGSADFCSTSVFRCQKVWGGNLVGLFFGEKREKRFCFFDLCCSREGFWWFLFMSSSSVC